MTNPPASDGVTSALPVPTRILAVGAHPDDVELQCGATLARWTAAGAQLTICVLTDGSKGTWNPDDDPEMLRRTRVDEARAAGASLGAIDVLFCGFVDGELTGAPHEVRAVCEVIRTIRPDLVLGHDPWKRYRLHPDHRRAGHLVTDGIVAARDPGFFPDAGPPHRPDRLLLFEADVVDHVEDVDGFLDAKLDALLCHRSQWHTTFGLIGDHPGPDASPLREQLRRQAAIDGAIAHLAYGEAFKLIQPL